MAALEASESQTTKLTSGLKCRAKSHEYEIALQQGVFPSKYVPTCTCGWSSPISANYWSLCNAVENWMLYHIGLPYTIETWSKAMKYTDDMLGGNLE